MNKISLFLILVMLNSCGTVFGGRIDDCQRTKPKQGKRQLRHWAILGDVAPSFIVAAAFGVFPYGAIVWTGIDLLTHGIYKPCPKNK